MTTIISGPGQGLPANQSLYPTQLNGAPVDVGTNFINLSPGDALPVPAGRWYVDTGMVSVLQFLDPTSGCWRVQDAQRGQPQQVLSDGFTRRVFNPTLCPVAAVIANGGSGFAQSTATITANVGGSTWLPVVGGSLSVSTVNVAGAGYTMAPLVLIPAPGNPGLPALAYATIASGTVSGVTLTNEGAGYIGAPTAVIVPNPTDPNFGAITQATVTLVLNAANAAKITAALITNNGAPLASQSALTLTAAGGAGTGATITPVVMSAISGMSAVAAGAGFTGGAELSTVGGVPLPAGSVAAISNPAYDMTSYRPRKASVLIANTAGALTTLAAVYDTGLFAGVPLVTVGALAGVIPTTAASITVTLGSVVDTIALQSV